jgi:hypothetical protein
MSAENTQESSNRKIGRPTSYTPALGEEICNAIASASKGLKQLCKENSHWPEQRNIYHWLTKHEEFRRLYALAKEHQIQSLVDEILEIADDTSQDSKINEFGESVYNSEYIARCRLRVDTRKWLAAKLCPRLYGERVQYNANIQTISHEEALKLLM